MNLSDRIDSRLYSVEKPVRYTGGAFGAEASILSVILGAALSALFIWGYLRKTRP